jgi:hypothetical protein
LSDCKPGAPGPDSGQLSIDALLDILEKSDRESEFFRHAARLLDGHLLAAGSLAPQPGRDRDRKFLTIGMATINDYDGVYFSVQSIRLSHPEVTADTEILVLDNNPEGPCADPLKKLESYVDGYRYVPFARWSGTAARDILFREAASEWVLVMDSHVLFAPGSLSRLISFFRDAAALERSLAGADAQRQSQGAGHPLAPAMVRGHVGQVGLRCARRRSERAAV